MKRKYKLHCFHCGNLFGVPMDVCKDVEGKPICIDCLYEHLDLWECNVDDCDIDCFLIGNSFKKFYDTHKTYECDICDYCVWVAKNDIPTQCPNCLAIKEDEMTEALHENFSWRGMKLSPHSTIKISAWAIICDSDCGSAYFPFRRRY